MIQGAWVSILGFEIKRFLLRAQGLRFRVNGLGVIVCRKSLGFIIQGLWFRAYDFGFSVWDLRIWDLRI
jgi:hypothetical protein